MVRKLKRDGQETNLLFWLLPLGLLCLGVFIIPVLSIVRLSFSESTLMRTSEAFTFASYGKLLTSPDFLSILRTTLVFVAAGVFFQVIIGFLIALYLDYGSQRGIRGTLVVRTSVLAAWAIPGVVIGVVWKIMFSEMNSGIITALSRLVLPAARPQFLSSPLGALVCSIVANVWRGTAYSMILLYAGLMTFPKDLNEAAQIDGANALMRLLRIKLPVLAPLFMICVLLVTVQTFNTFDMIMALTGGGPGRSTEVMALNIYKTIFNDFDLGRGSAAAMLLLGINIGITFLYFRMLKGADHE